MTLTEMTARVRQDLQDTDAANYRWTDAEIAAAIERVVREFSLAYPIEQQSEITTTADSKEINITSLTSLIKIATVEYPMDQEPPCYQLIHTWADKLYMDDKGDGVRKARVRWLKQHTLGATTTIPAQFEEIIVLGTTGYLAASASAYTVDRASIAGQWATINFLKWGQTRLELYERKLKAISRNNRIISKEFYTDEGN